MPACLPESRFESHPGSGDDYIFGKDRLVLPHHNNPRALGLLWLALVSRVAAGAALSLHRSLRASAYGVDFESLGRFLSFAEQHIDRPGLMSPSGILRFLSIRGEPLRGLIASRRRDGREGMALGRWGMALEAVDLTINAIFDHAAGRGRESFTRTFSEFKNHCFITVLDTELYNSDWDEWGNQSKLIGLIEPIPEWIDNSHNWETETARGIARSMADTGAWDRGPLLADALEDADCSVGWLLEFLRDPGFVDVAFRGMWFLEWLRGTPFFVTPGTVQCFLVRDHPFEHIAFGRAEYNRDKPVLSDSLRKQGQAVANLLNTYKITVAEAKERLAKIFF